MYIGFESKIVEGNSLFGVPTNITQTKPNQT